MSEEDQPDAAPEVGDIHSEPDATGPAEDQDAATSSSDEVPAKKAGAPAEKKVAEKKVSETPARKKATTKPAIAASGGALSGYGWASVALGLVAAAALIFSLVTWKMHHDDVNERIYRSRVMQTAAGWTSVLINLNAENVESGMSRLRDKTVGELNSEFDAALAPYREVVQRIQSRSNGRVEAVAIEQEHSDLDDSAAGSETPSNLGRTDPVMVIATSIAENVGGRPQTVHWVLKLDVTDVAGNLMISRLRSIR